MRLICVAAAVILLPLTAGAQTVVTAFSELPTVIRSGDTIDVTDANGRKQNQRIVADVSRTGGS